MRALIAVHKKIALQRLATLAHDTLFPPRLPAGLAWWWFLWTLSGDSEYHCFGLWRPTLTPVSVPAPPRVGHLHTEVQQFTHTETCLCTRSIRGGSPAQSGTTVHTHWHLSLYPLCHGWVTCTRGYNSSHTLTPVSIPTPSQVGHLHTGVKWLRFTHSSGDTAGATAWCWYLSLYPLYQGWVTCSQGYKTTMVHTHRPLCTCSIRGGSLFTRLQWFTHSSDGNCNGNGKQVKSMLNTSKDNSN